MDFFSLVRERGGGAVGVHDPDVVAAFAVADEDDFLAIGGVFGLIVPCHAAGEAGHGSAGDRERVEIAKDIDEEGFAIG